MLGQCTLRIKLIYLQIAMPELNRGNCNLSLKISFPTTIGFCQVKETLTVIFLTSSQLTWYISTEVNSGLCLAETLHFWIFSQFQRHVQVLQLRVVSGAAPCGKINISRVCTNAIWGYQINSTTERQVEMMSFDSELYTFESRAYVRTHACMRFWMSISRLSMTC